MFILDEIVDIKYIGKRNTIDLETDGNNLFIANDILTHNSGFGDAEINLTDISDSIGTAATADIIIGVTQSEEFRKMGKFNWIILKNRYGLNKHTFPVNVDYYKMRIFEDSDGQTAETAASISKIPPSDREKQKAVDDTVQDVKDILNKDLKDKFDKMTGKFDDIE